MTSSDAHMMLDPLKIEGGLKADHLGPPPKETVYKKRFDLFLFLNLLSGVNYSYPNRLF